MNSKKSSVSIIITTRNSGQTLQALLKSIKDQTYKKIETIVVDNNSSDGTVDIAKRYIKNVYDKGPERSAQRNFGAKAAKGDYLFFLDSDMVLTKNVVEECIRGREVGGGKWEVGGIVIPEKSFGWGFWAKVKAFEREINRGEPYLEAARFFPNKVFWEFRGYDESLTGPEDWDLPQRISKKYKLGRIKSHILHNEGRVNLFGLAKKKFYYGLSAHKYLTKQKISLFSPVTLYFLRPAFYREWLVLLSHPMLSLGLLVMLTFESVGGGLGYIVGRCQK